MVDKILSLLSSLLGSDNALYLWTKATFAVAGKSNLLLVTGIVFTSLWIFFMFHLTWKRWSKYSEGVAKKGKGAVFSEYVDLYGTELAIKFVLGTGILGMVYGSGGAIDILDGLFKIFGQNDGTNYRGIFFLFGYNQASVAYQWIIGSAAVLSIVCALRSIWYAILYYVVYDGAEGFDNDGKPTNRLGRFKQYGTVCVLLVVIFFSTIPELTLNNLFFKTFAHTTIHEYLTNSKKLTEAE